MANFFTDNQDMVAQLERLDLQRIVDLLEGGYESSGDGDDANFPAPTSYADAMEFYAQSIELLGDITANSIAPHSLEIDAEGSELHDDGQVTYAKGTVEAREVLSESGFMGVMLPRKYGGAGVPATIYMMMIELVSRADASLMTLFGYQDVGELIARFGTEEQASEFLPGLASGDKIGAIVLSEPGAGSDLQAVQLKASEDADGQWRLNGTKHFISNGCGDVLMVLARSEEKISNIFGLSLFVCPKSDAVKVARVEEKMGLHGSPTCELLFQNAPAQLIGKRKAGLTRYVLESLNQARFSVAAQALGIAEGAYRYAYDYAQDRVQFGKRIVEFPAVQELLDKMRLSIESSRAILYDSVTWLDLKVQLSEAIEEGHLDENSLAAAKLELRQASKFSSLLSPLVKYSITEACQTVCIDAQQVFGGLGYMQETGIEQLVRDVRITTIYEGTSQVQVSSSLKHIMSDILADLFDAAAAEKHDDKFNDVAKMIAENRVIFAQLVAALNDRKSPALNDAAARDLADIYIQIFGSYALLRRTNNDADREQLLRQYVVDANAFATARLLALRNGRYDKWLNNQESKED